MVTTNSEIADAPKDSVIPDMGSVLSADSGAYKPTDSGAKDGGPLDTFDKMHAAAGSLLSGDANSAFNKTAMANATDPTEQQARDERVQGYGFNAARAVMNHESPEQTAKFDEIAHRAASGEGKKKS